MLGNDKSIRSSLAVKEVVGELSGDHLSKVIEEKCEAGHLRIDASSKSQATAHSQLMEYLADIQHNIAGSFAISEDTKPRVINLDFPALPPGDSRSQKLIENGMEEKAGRLYFVKAYIYQMPSSPLFLTYFRQTSIL